jgi:hypothetical protein
VSPTSSKTGATHEHGCRLIGGYSIRGVNRQRIGTPYRHPLDAGHPEKGSFLGSDSLLMKFGFSLAWFRGKNQHHAARPSAVGARA